MPPAVIDLTSSPEPDDSPEALARSSLHNFQPRKQKPNGDLKNRPQSVQKHGNPPSAATQETTLVDSQPLKKKLKSNGEYFSDKNSRRNGHAVSTGSSLPSRSTPELSPSDVRRDIANGPHEKRRTEEGRIREGSLASILAKSSPNSSPAEARSVRHERQVTTTPERASNSGQPAGNENERLKVLGAFQRVPPKAKPQPQMISREKTVEKTPTKPRPMSAPNKPLRETIDLEADESIENSSIANETKRSESISVHDEDSMRPVKRRRTNDSEPSTIQVQHPLQRKLQEQSQTPSTVQSIDRIPIRSTSPSIHLPSISSETPNGQMASKNASITASSHTSPHDAQPTATAPTKSHPTVESEELDNRKSYKEILIDLEKSPSPLTKIASIQAFKHSNLATNNPEGSKQEAPPQISSTSPPAAVFGSFEHPIDLPDTSLEFVPLVDSDSEDSEEILGRTQIVSNSIQPNGGSLEDSSTHMAHIPDRESEVIQPRSKDAIAMPKNLNSDKSQPSDPPQAKPISQETPNNRGAPGGVYSAEEDALLVKLKEVDGLPWNKIVPHFNRSFGSLQVRYSTKLKGRTRQGEAVKDNLAKKACAPVVLKHTAVRSHLPDADADADTLTRRPRKRRNIEPAAAAGYISWAEIKKRQLVEQTDPRDLPDDSPLPPKAHTKFEGEHAYPKSLLRILRQRELGTNFGRSWTPSRRSIPVELKERVLDDIGPLKYFKGTSGDVTCLAWAPDGRIFAAGSIAITDERSMQYNRPCNLLLGDKDRSLLKELPEHHIQRPKITADGNVNGLHSMQETQDPRLFMTVASVQFSPDGQTLYSAGSDRKVRAYRIADDVSCLYEIDHPAPLDLISVSNLDILATACHQSTGDSIGIYRGPTRMLSLSPSRVNFPSTLKWGIAAHHSNLLLAGFSVDSVNEEQNITGETALWDLRSETRINLSGMTRNVFDVAWNPSPSSGSSIFAVASSPGIDKASKETRSVVQCFAPLQNRARKVFEWECPAFDINDVVYCQHDTNLIAAGATDGKVYVWDHRFIKRSNGPLHTLLHGNTLNVLDHDRDREVADTGIRFLSWGATSSRLFTGSSDGVVKVWNPYRSSEDAHLKDVAAFDSAVMSGAFSPDYRDLLIGEDQGRINLLSVGYDHKAVRSMQRFELQSASAPTIRDDPFAAARELRKSEQVAIKPMGDLPKRQAVQGPHYSGPYLRPSETELMAATNEYQLALDVQNNAESQKASSLSQSDEDNQRAQQANNRVQIAQSQMTHLYRRLDDSDLLEPLARENQHAFLRAAERRRELEISHRMEACKLDCNYVPASTDDGEVPDSSRSEMRIPGALRASRPAVSADMSKEEIMQSGLTAKCTSCLGAARKAPRGKQTLCDRCQLARLGLNASCDLCSNPIRLSTENSDSPNLCERCSFACFRCGGAILIPRDVSLITCNKCELSWQAGVLGYELVGGRDDDLKTRRPQERSADDTSENEHLGDSEITHYASRWQIR